MFTPAPWREAGAPGESAWLILFLGKWTDPDDESAPDPMTLAEQFRTWALDPARTGEELYTAELFVETAQELWNVRQKIYARDYEAIRERQKRRKLNPAYRPTLTPAALDLVVAMWSEIKDLRNGMIASEERPVSDLAALRFFPQLTGVELTSRLSDLRGLVGLQQLNRLKLWDETLDDLGALAEVPSVTDISLHLGTAWPSVGALGALPGLRNIYYTGNLLALQDVREWPVIERAWLQSDWQWSTPLRDAQGLPAMPVVKHLKVDGVAALRGIERFTTVHELDVRGPFADLGPLTGLTEVRELTLGGERFFDLAPISRMSRLRTLELERERGLDPAPLADSASLRKVSAPRCAVLATELATLNAALGFVDESIYVLPEPRQLGPVRWISYNPQREDFKLGERKTRSLREPRVEAYGDDPLLDPAERAWFERELKRRMKALLEPGWGNLQIYMAGRGNLTLRRYQDVLHVGEVVDAVRRTIAAARFPWEILLLVEPHGDLSEDLDEIEARHGDADDGETFNVEREREEWNETQERLREHREFIEREHQLRLQQQEGRPIDPAAFSPPGTPPPPANDDGETVTARAGGEEAEDFGKDFGFTAIVSEEFVWVHDSGVENASGFFGVPFENWHALPEPPEERPRPA